MLAVRLTPKFSSFACTAGGGRIVDDLGWMGASYTSRATTHGLLTNELSLSDWLGTTCVLKRSCVVRVAKRTILGMQRALPLPPRPVIAWRMHSPADIILSVASFVDAGPVADIPRKNLSVIEQGSRQAAKSIAARRKVRAVVESL